jgi:hypothetical protein
MDSHRLTRRDLLAVAPHFILAAPMAALTIWVQYTHVNARGAEWICASLAHGAGFASPAGPG